MSTVENCGNGTHGHGTFNSNKKGIILITQLIEYRSKLAKRTAKSKKNQGNCQRQMFQIANLSVPKYL